MSSGLQAQEGADSRRLAAGMATVLRLSEFHSALPLQIEGRP